MQRTLHFSKLLYSGKVVEVASMLRDVFISIPLEATPPGGGGTWSDEIFRYQIFSALLKLSYIFDSLSLKRQFTYFGIIKGEFFFFRVFSLIPASHQQCDKNWGQIWEARNCNSPPYGLKKKKDCQLGTFLCTTHTIVLRQEYSCHHPMFLSASRSVENQVRIKMRQSRAIK